MTVAPCILYCHLDTARPCALDLEDGLGYARSADERRVGCVEDNDRSLVAKVTNPGQGQYHVSRWQPCLRKYAQRRRESERGAHLDIFNVTHTRHDVVLWSSPLSITRDASTFFDRSGHASKSTAGLHHYNLCRSDVILSASQT